MREKYHLLLSANKAYMEQTVVCMNSIMQNNPENVLHFHILHSEIEEDVLEQVQNWVQEKSTSAEVSFYSIHSASYFFPVKPGDTISCETYFRILAPERLPQNLEKILYVDGDTLCLGSLAELWETELEEYAAASREVAVPAYRKQNLGMGDNSFYFQAGVMLINLRWWREHNITEKTLRFIEEHPDILPRWDQDALNAVLAGKIKKIDPKWNVCLDILPAEQWEERNPVIVHYTGSQLFKPWFKNSISEYQLLYLEYKKDTPYCDSEQQLCLSSQLSFPLRLVQPKDRVVLYGAGQFGKAYYLQNKRCGFCEIVSWIDKDYGKEIYGRQILPPVTLLDMDYDRIMIAVSAESMKEEIKSVLQEIGVASEHILWNPPIYPMKVKELKTYAQWEAFFVRTEQLIVCGHDEVAMMCLGYFVEHSARQKIERILILGDLKEIAGMEVQNLDGFSYSSAPILLAVNDCFHSAWLAELYDRGCRDVYVLSNTCYEELRQANQKRSI